MLLLLLGTLVSCRVQSPTPALPAVVQAAHTDSPDSQGKIDVLNYFVMQVPGSPCLADKPDNPGSISTIYRVPSPNCSQHKAVYIWNKDWASETFFVEDNKLKAIEEVHYDANRGIEFFRTMREDEKGRKGVTMMPLKISAQGEAWDLEAHVEENWTDAAGKPACRGGVHPNSTEGSSYKAEAYFTAYRGWLQDRRRSSVDPNRWHDVQVLVLVDYWGDNQKEYYYYGKWINPATGRSEGVSLIKWEWFDKRKKKQTLENHYLVDCTLSTPCWNCYDP